MIRNRTQRRKGPTLMEELQTPLLVTETVSEGAAEIDGDVLNTRISADHEDEQLDEQSSASSSSASSLYEPVLIYWSNITFLVGSCLYFSLSLIDWQDAAKNSQGSVDTDDDNDEGWSFYTLFALLAPLSYLVNAIQDIYKNLKKDPGDSFCTKGLCIDLLFGLAAFLDAAGTMVETLGFGHEFVSEKFVDYGVLSTSAVHVYLLQAIIVCWVRVDDYDSVISNYLGWCGDALFLVGSLIDVIISYMVLESMEESHIRWVLAASLLSSTLWLVDAIFYISADCVEYRHFHQQQQLASFRP